jgi:hypothetical protein
MLEGHGTIMVNRSSTTMTVANTGQACGRRLTFEDAPRLTIINPPAHGSAVLTGPNFSYTPSAGYVGPDRFVIQRTISEQAFSEYTFDVVVVAPDRRSRP